MGAAHTNHWGMGALPSEPPWKIQGHFPVAKGFSLPHKFHSGSQLQRSLSLSCLWSCLILVSMPSIPSLVYLPFACSSSRCRILQHFLVGPSLTLTLVCSLLFSFAQWEQTPTNPGQTRGVTFLIPTTKYLAAAAKGGAGGLVRRTAGDN